MDTHELFEKIATAFGITVLSVLVYIPAFYLIKRWAAGKKRILPKLLQSYLYYPGLIFILILGISSGLPVLGSYMPDGLLAILLHIAKIAAIINGGILAMRIIVVLREVMLDRLEKKSHKDYQVRKANTQFKLLQRIFDFVIVGFMIAGILMTFESVRQLGSTLLASAGVVGIVIGFAAQKSIGTLIAGLQTAIAQPVKLGDSVVVENEFGIVEELTLTYAVIKIWDERRLIVPVSYFLENSFTNWTRTSSQIISKVKIYADYSLPVEDIRKKFRQLLKESSLWDKRVAALQVTNATEKTIEIRGIMSAGNASDAYDLECLMREKLVEYIRENHPESLPTYRATLSEQLVKEIR